MQVLTTPRFFSRYRVDEDGRLFRVRFKKEGSITLFELNSKPKKNGYIYNRLTDDAGNVVTVQRGRLMLLAFADDSYFDGAESDHINRITTDNRIENLRWLSHRDNCCNRRYLGREKDRALYLVYDDGTVELYQCRKTTNICSPTLSRILSGSHSQKYKCIGFYADRLHQQSADVQRIVRDSTANSIADTLTSLTMISHNG